MINTSLTLDNALDRFEDSPSKDTALDLMVTAAGYHRDKMIGLDEVVKIIHMTKPYISGEKRAG